MQIKPLNPMIETASKTTSHRLMNNRLNNLFGEHNEVGSKVMATALVLLATAYKDRGIEFWVCLTDINPDPSGQNITFKESCA